MEKILHGGSVVLRGQCFFRFSLTLLSQRQPLAFPSLLVTGLDLASGSRDIEYIAPALLRLRNEAKSLTAERMSGREKIKHNRFLTVSIFGWCMIPRPRSIS